MVCKCGHYKTASHENGIGKCRGTSRINSKTKQRIFTPCSCEKYQEKKTITASCGCKITDSKDIPQVELICEEHIGSALYNNYDGKEAEICDLLVDSLQDSKVKQ